MYRLVAPEGNESSEPIQGLLSRRSITGTVCSSKQECERVVHS